MKKYKSWLFLFGIWTFLARCSTDEEWITMFDGQSLAGWRAAEQESSFRAEDGAIVCDGSRAHLFFEGESGRADFKNFEFLAEVRTTPGSNSGIYFHTEFQVRGWPSKGYEAQVLNSSRSEAGVERKMTGSLYAIRNVWKSPAQDDQWFEYRIRVVGKTIRIYINEELVVDYTEPADPPRLEGMEERLLSSGTFALQCHDRKSRVYYRNLRVKHLPDTLETPGAPLEDPVLSKRLVELAGQNFPLMDLHVHLKQDLDLEQALANARRYGFTYGIAVNCGLGMTIPDKKSLDEYLNSYNPPAHSYSAIQAEGREWVNLFSSDQITQFDYVFTDSMTWTNDDGKRMRLWIEEEVEVGDPQTFVETLVDRTVTILDEEPIQIYVNPTYLPEEIADQYADLWTLERMDRVIEALLRNGVALEINDRRQIPSPTFIKRAKAAGVQFTFGTNNAAAEDLGHLQYCLDMIDECGLTPSDMWIPPVR